MPQANCFIPSVTIRWSSSFSVHCYAWRGRDVRLPVIVISNYRHDACSRNVVVSIPRIVQNPIQFESGMSNYFLRYETPTKHESEIPLDNAVTEKERPNYFLIISDHQGICTNVTSIVIIFHERHFFLYSLSSGSTHVDHWNLIIASPFF